MDIKKLFNILTVFGFCLIIFAAPVLTKLEPHTDYSIFENRTLTAPPVFSFESLFKCEYLPAWDKYYSDHMCMRTGILKVKNIIDVNLMHRPVVNDVVIQKDYLLPFQKYDQDASYVREYAQKMGARLASLNDLVNSYGGKFIYIGVPEQYSMFRDFYPAYLNNNDELLSSIESSFFTELDSYGIDYINMRTEFYKTKDYTEYYSKADHHYNLFGAFLTYQTLINHINKNNGGSAFDSALPVLTENDIEFIKLDNPFYGSRNRKLYNSYSLDDRLYYYVQKNPLEFTRINNGVNVAPQVFKTPSDNYSPVTYDLYMSGDIAETIIITARPYLHNALLFGDSFTNPFETFLYQSFNETRSLDMRHYKECTILEYIERYKPDFVFCMRDDTAYLSFDGNGNIK